MTTASITLTNISEQRLVQLAQDIAFLAKPDDLITLAGELGVGKTTFARGMIRALLDDCDHEIPSPTYTLVQAYESARMPIHHFDLYRLSDASELVELGLDHALTGGLAIIEWPDRADDDLPIERLEIALTDHVRSAKTLSASDTRDITLTAHGPWEPRLVRLQKIRELRATCGWDEENVRIAYLQGDASARRYARVHRATGERALLMDWPRQPDGPPIRGGLPYSQIAHLAEDVHAFVAIADTLRAAGLSTPVIHAADLESGLLICEDLGDGVFGNVLDNCTTTRERTDMQKVLWRAATDTLIALRDIPIPDHLDMGPHRTPGLPQFDYPALAIETDLLPEWYWPFVHNTDCEAGWATKFRTCWQDIAARVLAEPSCWLLRDYHSPNLIWLPDRPAPRNVGIIDFQDAMVGPAAYDLVSLLQDARLDVPEDIEAELLRHYCHEAAKRGLSFDVDRFIFGYRALGAQRNTKILGIFARLAKRDGKPQYLGHLPRIWRYLERNLQHPGLAELRQLYADAFPPELRQRLPQDA